MAGFKEVKIMCKLKERIVKDGKEYKLVDCYKCGGRGNVREVYSGDLSKHGLITCFVCNGDRKSYKEVGPEYQKYSEVRPEVEGWYRWRVAHSYLKDIKVVFLAGFRLRSAGFGRVLSPEFDYWDGYNVLVPPSTEWAPYKGHKPNRSEEIININELENEECPFCKKVPHFEYSSRLIGGAPIQSEYFRLACCDWINHSRLRDPIRLSQQWNALIRGMNG